MISFWILRTSSFLPLYLHGTWRTAEQLSWLNRRKGWKTETLYCSIVVYNSKANMKKSLFKKRMNIMHKKLYLFPTVTSSRKMSLLSVTWHQVSIISQLKQYFFIYDNISKVQTPEQILPFSMFFLIEWVGVTIAGSSDKITSWVFLFCGSIFSCYKTYVFSTGTAKCCQVLKLESTEWTIHLILKNTSSWF